MTEIKYQTTRHRRHAECAHCPWKFVVDAQEPELQIEDHSKLLLAAEFHAVAKGHTVLLETTEHTRIEVMAVKV